MSLSTSRQQFLAYESQGPEPIRYGRKGGMFVSTCLCVSFIIFTVVLAALVGAIVYFITYFKLSQKSTDYWDEAEPFGEPGPPSPDLRLPPHIEPSFYRLKFKADLEESTYTGDVYITIRASKSVKEIILHSKNLSISDNAKLTEQIYERVQISSRVKRRAQEESSNVTNTDVPENSTTQASSTVSPDTSPVSITLNPLNITELHIDDNVTVTTPLPTINVSENTETTTPIPVTTVNTQVTHSNVRNIHIVSIAESTGDRLILTLATPLKPNIDYTLQLSFKGNISNSLTGFYKSSYTNANKEEKQLGVTQFEPTSARSAFPCFDEPAFKAKFEISIAHSNNLTVLSNMKVAAEEPIAEKAGWKWTHFERSVKMSTYLVAYVLSDFKSVETTYLSTDNTTKLIRIWTRPELINKAQYALSITPKLLVFYEEVFGVPYALDKLDMIAIPDFSSGAMENWGLITFRETTLLFDEKDSVPRDKQNVCIDVAHELAHQWFGNLVTMRWWTDLWLNEGFATYIEYVGVNHIAPEWNMLESFSNDKMDLLRSDALKNTSPVSKQVVDASEISQKFDEISYTKGANLIRMLNHTITQELFQKGLKKYLNDWKYSNAEENDLWAAMSSGDDVSLLGADLVRFMNSWTRQRGYPLVRATRDYVTGEVLFEQSLFTSTADPYPDMLSQTWHIPLSYTALGGRGAGDGEADTRPRAWLRERTLRHSAGINDTDALYVNVGAIGYYRVNYDKRNWALLSEALKTGKVQSPVTKAQLIDDAFNLAKAGLMDYADALSLTTCVINGEDSKLVWDLLLNNMLFLLYNLRTTSGFVYFEDYMKILLEKQLKRLNYGLDQPKDDNEAFLIENLLLWDCLVESPRCIAWARDQFATWTNETDFNNNPIPRHLRSLVYNMALRHGGRTQWAWLWKVFSEVSDPAVKGLAVSNLPATREPHLITLLLEKSISEIPKQYAVAVWSVEPRVGTRIAQDFLIDNFDTIYDKFTAIDAFMFPTILNGAFGSITTTEELDKLKALALKHKEKLIPMSQTLRKLVDTATLRINWLKKYATSIIKWFKDYVSANTTETTTERSIVSNVSLNTNVPEHVTATSTEPEPTTTTEISNTTTNAINVTTPSV